MSEYIFVVIWIVFMAFMANVISIKRTEYVLGEKQECYPWWFAILTILPVVIAAGTRGKIADTTAYIQHYLSMPNSFADIPAYLATETKDTGFYLLSSILHVILKDNYTYYFLILAGFQGFSLCKLYRKYSENFLMSTFLFVISADYFSWMYNGLRQFMAVTIILLVTPLMIKNTYHPIIKKYIPVIGVILIASTCHQSALLMIPIVFIAQGEAFNKRTLLFIVAVILSIVFIDRFTDFLVDSLATTQYENVVSDYTSFGDDGTNPIRVLVYSVPTIFAILGRKYIRYNGNKLISFCTNMSIISSGLYIVSMFTSGIFLGRLPIYCSLYGYILLPWEINHMFTERSKMIMYLIMICAYFIYYYYQMHIAWGII